MLMKFHPITFLCTLLCALLLSSSCFSQSDFTPWIKEVEIEGKKIQILRVPADEITMPRARYDVLDAQKQLDRCFKEYTEGKQAYKSMIEANIQFLQVNVPGWPVSYYEQELKAYLAYNIVQEKRSWEQSVAKHKRIDDSTRLAKQVAGYVFINKPSVLLKEKPSAKSMTMATLYRGSYVQFEGALDSTDYIVVHAGTGIGYTGYIHAGDIVDSLYKLDIPEEEMAVVKSRYYCKIQESAAYGAMIQKLVDREMAAEAKTSSSGSGRSRVYYTGPRGGCYYINSNGNKTYVDRSLCK
jgi:hypothetical protein